MSVEDYFYSSLSDQEIENTLLGAVRFNTSQELTTRQKARARENIGAGEASTSFKILGFFATLDDLKNYLTMFPQIGDAYGVSRVPTAMSEYLSPDGAQAEFTISEQPYYIKITEVATGTVLEQGVDYAYFTGTIIFTVTPEAGTDSYLVEWYDETAPYDVYTWDGITEDWMNNGPMLGQDIIDDNDVVDNKTWSSQKISDELGQIDLTTLIDDSTEEADKTWSSDKISTELGGLSDDIKATTAIHLSDSITTFPKTISSASILKNMRVASCEFGTPSVISADVAWTMADGSVTLSGSLASGGSTTISLTLVPTSETTVQSGVILQPLKSSVAYSGLTATNKINSSESNYKICRSGGLVTITGYLSFASGASGTYTSHDVYRGAILPNVEAECGFIVFDGNSTDVGVMAITSGGVLQVHARGVTAASKKGIFFMTYVALEPYE